MAVEPRLYTLTEFQRHSRRHRGVPAGVHASRCQSEMRQASACSVWYSNGVRICRPNSRTKNRDSNGQAGLVGEYLQATSATGAPPRASAPRRPAGRSRNSTLLRLPNFRARKSRCDFGAGNGTRTRNIQLGKQRFGLPATPPSNNFRLFRVIASRCRNVFLLHSRAALELALECRSVAEVGGAGDRPGDDHEVSSLWMCGQYPRGLHPSALAASRVNRVEA